MQIKGGALVEVADLETSARKRGYSARRRAVTPCGSTANAPKALKGCGGNKSFPPQAIYCLTNACPPKQSGGLFRNTAELLRQRTKLLHQRTMLLHQRTMLLHQRTMLLRQRTKLHSPASLIPSPARLSYWRYSARAVSSRAPYKPEQIPPCPRSGCVPR